jgi:hypothetical protein
MDSRRSTAGCEAWSAIKLGKGMPWWWPIPQWHGGWSCTCSFPMPITNSHGHLCVTVRVPHGACWKLHLLAHRLPSSPSVFIKKGQKSFGRVQHVKHYLQTLPIQASTRVLLSYVGPLFSFYLFWKCCWILFHKPYFLHNLNFKPYIYL